LGSELAALSLGVFGEVGFGLPNCPGRGGGPEGSCPGGNSCPKLRTEAATKANAENKLRIPQKSANRIQTFDVSR